MKPAETGCRREGALLYAEDGALLGAACRPPLAHDVVAPLRYAPPVAPSVAAALEGPPFSIAPTHAALAAATARGATFAIVEGAGGLLVPYDDTLLGADVAAALGFPLLVVARAQLGTINHTLLTLAEARHRGLAVAGVVLVLHTRERAPDVATNAAQIERHAHGVRVIGAVPWIPPSDRRDPARLAAAVEGALDVAALLG